MHFITHQLKIFIGITMSENIKHVTDDSFENEVLKSNLPVVVDFWAEWCNPCKMIAPVLEDLAVEYAGKLKIVKLDVQENPQTPQKYNVHGIPTLIIFKNGELVDRKVGALPKAQLSAFFEASL